MFSGEKPAELHLEQTGGVLSLQLSGNCHNLFQSIKIFKILLSKELSAQWKIYRLKHLTKFVTKLSRPCMGSHSGSNLCEFTLPGRLLKSSNRNYWKSTICSTTGCSIWKSWIQPSVLETFYDILKLSLVLTHSVGWALLLLGKKFDIPAQFDSKEWVFWSLLFLQNLRFDWFSVFLKNSFLLQMRINDQIQT